MVIDTSVAHAGRQPTGARTRHEIVADRRYRSAPRRAGRLTARVLYVVVVLGFAGLVAAEATGYRLLAIKSGSMTPTLAVGDLVVSRAVPPGDVHRGEIVTFRDPQLGRRLVTHRVLSVRRRGGQVDFVTKGDANRVGEHWSVPVSGRVGKEIAAFSGMGRVLGWSFPILAITGIVVAAIALSTFVLRRIWAGDASHDTAA